MYSIFKANRNRQFFFKLRTTAIKKDTKVIDKTNKIDLNKLNKSMTLQSLIYRDESTPLLNKQNNNHIS